MNCSSEFLSDEPQCDFVISLQDDLSFLDDPDLKNFLFEDKSDVAVDEQTPGKPKPLLVTMVDHNGLVRVVAG